MLSKSLVQPSNLGLLVLLAGLMLLVVAKIGAELFMMRFSMLIVICGLVVYLGGRELGGITAVPIMYMAFMIPLPAIIWNKIAFPLKLFATSLAVASINGLAIPVYREGNVLRLANTTLEVVDACSGLRSLTSLLAISAAFALITDQSRPRKWVLFLSAVPIAIVANVMRLTVTAALSHRYGEGVAQGFMHEFSGIMVFALAIIFLYLVNMLLQRMLASKERQEK
jgi:exosortase